MLSVLFESKEKSVRDAQELRTMKIRYGGELMTVLEARARDTQLSDRDRKHWKRMLRKARSGA
jgi:hypothetical protein